MLQGRIGRGLRILALAGIFGVGYLCGQLGSSIVEMQQHVDGLNKDLETLRKVKTALGG